MDAIKAVNQREKILVYHCIGESNPADVFTNPLSAEEAKTRTNTLSHSQILTKLGEC